MMIDVHRPDGMRPHVLVDPDGWVALKQVAAGMRRPASIAGMFESDWLFGFEVYRTDREGCPCTD